MSATTHTAHVCWDIQLASELIAVQEKLGQIDEDAELLGQFSCKKVECQQTLQRMYAGTYNRTCEAIALQLEVFQFDEVAELLGQLSCSTQVNVSKHTIHVCWDIQHNSPPMLFA
jgi:hypothetical protein